MLAAAARRSAERDARVTMAWLNAVLGRAAKIPALDEILTGGRRPLEPEELQAHMRALATTMPQRSWEEWQALS